MGRWAAWALVVGGVVALLLALIGGGGGETVDTGIGSATAPPRRTTSTVRRQTTTTQASTTTCSNEELRLTLRYPAEWHELSCQFFGRAPVVVDPTRNDPRAEISVFADFGSFARAKQTFAVGDVRTTSSRDTTIGGAAAAVIDFEYPDDPEQNGRLYVIDRGDEPALVVIARRVDTPDFDETLDVLDDLARSVRLS